jgi:hypothetical protein
MSLGENTPKLTIPVTWIDAVPNGAVGGGGVRGRRSVGEDALLGTAGCLGLASEKVVELGQLELDGGVHLRPPLGERLVRRRGRLLQIGEARVAEVFRNGHLVEALGEGGFMDREALLDLSAELLRHFLDEKLDVGIHGTELVLLAARVVDGLQGGAGPRQLIPIVSSLLMPPTQLESREEEGRRRAGNEEQQRASVGRKSVCFSVTILDTSSTVTGLFIGPHTRTQA